MTAAATIRDQDRAHPERVGYSLMLMLILMFVGLSIGLGVGVRGEDFVELLLALVTAAIALLPLVFDQGRRPSERQVLLSTFSIVFIIGFVLPVLVIFIPGEGPKEAPSYSWSALYPVDVIRGQLATILGLLCLLIGHASPAGPALATIVPKFRTDWPPSVSVAIGMFMLPIGWAAMLSSLVGIRLAEIGGGLLSVLVSSTVYSISLLSIVFLRHRSRVALLLVAIVVPMTSFFGLFTGSKGAILIPGVMVALSFIVVQRRIRARWILLGILVSTLVFPVSKFVRSDVLQQYTISAAVALKNPGRTLRQVSNFLSGSQPAEYFVEGLVAVVGRMDCIGAASVLIRDTPKVAPFQNGKTLVLFFYAFVPRAIWPDKPTITIGRYITDVYGSGPEIDSSTAPTQLGEYFINFGYTGIIFGMLLYGIVLRLAHEVLLRGPPTTPALFVGVVILLRLGMGFQGDTANGWAQTVTSIVPIVLAHLAVVLMFARRPSLLPSIPAAGGSAAVENPRG